MCHDIINNENTKELKINKTHSAFSTLRIFHTPHFPHSSFSTLRILHTPHFPHSDILIFHTPHSALHIIHRTRLSSVNILRSQRKSRSSEQFLEGCKQPWNFDRKGRKFYTIAFLTLESTFRSREGFFFQSKHGSPRGLNL